MAAAKVYPLFQVTLYVPEGGEVYGVEPVSLAVKAQNPFLAALAAAGKAFEREIPEPYRPCTWHVRATELAGHDGEDKPMLVRHVRTDTFRARLVDGKPYLDMAPVEVPEHVRNENTGGGS